MQNKSWDQQVVAGQLEESLDKYTSLIGKVTTESQVTRLQYLIQNEHKEQTQNLCNFIESSQTSHNKQLRKLELQRTDLTNSLSQYQTALASVNTTNNTTSAIHSNIESIDLQRALIKKTLLFLTQVRSLKNNISLIHSALQSHDYMVAAKAINEVRALPAFLIDSQFVKKVVPSSEIPEIPRILLDEWCTKLTQLFKARFTEAAQSQNIQDLTLMFKMFPMVGENTLGLDLYSKYICNIIANESRKIMTDKTENSQSKASTDLLFYSKVVLHLFKIVSTVINEHSKIIASSYGMEHMTYAMEKIEKETDLQTGLVLDIFLENRKVDHILSDVREWDAAYKKRRNVISSSTTEFQGHNRSASNGGINDDQSLDHLTSYSLNDLTILVDEFSNILQNWSMYSRFFSIRWYEFSNTTIDILTPPPPVSNSKFLSKLQNEEIFSKFETLVMHNLCRSFEKSLKIEELPSLNDFISANELEIKDIASNPISSVIEDLSIFIKKNLVFTVNTGQFLIIDHFLTQFSNFIQNEFLVKFMQGKFKFLQSRLNTSISLKKYLPKIQGEAHGSTTNLSRSHSPALFGDKYGSTTLSQLGMNFRGAAATALTNIQSNIQAAISDEDAILSLHHYLIYINTLYVEIVFIHKLLIEEIIEEKPHLLKDNFPFENEHLKVSQKLQNCEQYIIKQTDKLKKWSIKYLLDNVIKTKIRALFSSIFVNGVENSYISNAEDFEDVSIMNEFVTKWKTLMVPYKNILCLDAYHELLSLVLDLITTQLERKIMALRVNELGAAKLDRELSIFIGAICGLNYVLREKFTKLTQIVLILGFDDDDMDPETNDLREELKSSIDWVLSPEERINIRSIKVD